MKKLNRDDLDVIYTAVDQALSIVTCNCSGECDGSCTRSDLEQAMIVLDEKLRFCHFCDKPFTRKEYKNRHETDVDIYHADCWHQRRRVPIIRVNL